VTLVATNP